MGNSSTEGTQQLIYTLFSCSFILSLFPKVESAFAIHDFFLKKSQLLVSVVVPDGRGVPGRAKGSCEGERVDSGLRGIFWFFFSSGGR